MRQLNRSTPAAPARPAPPPPPHVCQWQLCHGGVQAVKRVLGDEVLPSVGSGGTSSSGSSTSLQDLALGFSTGGARAAGTRLPQAAVVLAARPAPKTRLPGPPHHPADRAWLPFLPCR